MKVQAIFPKIVLSSVILIVTQFFYDYSNGINHTTSIEGSWKNLVIAVILSPRTALNAICLFKIDMYKRKMVIYITQCIRGCHNHGKRGKLSKPFTHALYIRNRGSEKLIRNKKCKSLGDFWHSFFRFQYITVNILHIFSLFSHWNNYNGCGIQKCNHNCHYITSIQ